MNESINQSINQSMSIGKQFSVREYKYSQTAYK